MFLQYIHNFYHKPLFLPQNEISPDYSCYNIDLHLFLFLESKISLQNHLIS